MTTKAEITKLLARARDGDRAALDRMLPLVYDELRGIARRQSAGRDPATMNTTAVVHELYLRLVSGSPPNWRDRSHFFAVASLAMRQILVDYARRRRAARRGGGAQHTTLADRDAIDPSTYDEIIMVHDALDRLTALNPRLARVVELRYFGGLSVEETAEVLEVTPRTVLRDWRKARAFLFKQLGDTGPP